MTETSIRNFSRSIALAGVHAHLSAILHNEGPDAQRLEAWRLEDFGWDDEILDARFDLDPYLTTSPDADDELWTVDLASVSSSRLQELSTELARVCEEADAELDWDVVDRCDLRLQDFDHVMTSGWNAV